MVDRDFDKYIAEIYRDMEIQLIQSMKRNLARHTLEEEEYGFNYPQWQAMKIKELRRYQRENGRILQGVSNKIPKDVSKHIKEELTQGSLDEMKKYREAMADGYKSAVAMKDSFFKINERKVNSLIKAVKNDLKTANTAALRMTNDVYREVIFKAGMFSANGVMTSKQAIDMATKDFLTRGINCIEYKDGRRVNIADYTSMAVRTANQRAYMIGEGEFRKRLGETLVIISQHNTSCEKCKPFERKVLIDDVYSGGTAEDGDYMLLSQAMAAGLFHPRCRHGLGTYYPELEDINGYETTDNRLNEYGDEELNRAHIENMVQRYRRLSEGSLDPDNIAKYQAKLSEWEKRRDERKSNSIVKTVYTETKKYYNANIDKEQFLRYKNILKENSPKTLEEFSKIKYNNTDEWDKLKYQYRTVNRYEVDGNVPIDEILKLDNAAYYTKKKGFDYSALSGKTKRKTTNEIANGGNAAAMELDGKTYFSHSKFGKPDSTEYSLYKGEYQAVTLSDKRIFNVKDLGDGIPREYDTEAKFLEFVATQKNPSDKFTVTILSEKHICESCQGVVEQFKNKYPNATVNIISGKKGYNGSSVGLRTWKHRKKVK